MLAPLQDQLNRIEAMVRVIMNAQSPHISFGEIRQKLGKSAKATQVWIRAHGLKRVGPRDYLYTDFVTAATRPHKQ